MLNENRIIAVEFESSNSPNGIDNKTIYKYDIIDMLMNTKLTRKFQIQIYK